ETTPLALLLDGLDEVKPECREACVAAINEFRLAHGLTPLAVCSRLAEYEAATKEAEQRLKLGGAIVLQPLEAAQVDAYLAVAGPGLAPLRAAIHHDPVLRELAQSPLMLGVTALAYQGTTSPLHQDRGGASLADMRHGIFETYVRRMLALKPA